MPSEGIENINGSDILKVCCAALEDTKAENIQILDVSGQSTITNFLILASAFAQPHLKALKRDLDKALKDQNVKILGVDEGEDSGWSVVDAFDVIIHIMTAEARETYDLESLWKDARPISLESILR